MQGIVAADGTPMITLTMAGQDWPAIIDTGFNGDSGSQILIGTHLLRDYRLQIDFVSKSVLLERAR